MREALAGLVELAIFTRDRDLGADFPYPDVPSNVWLENESGSTFYATPDLFGYRGLSGAASGRHFDVVYLNSFFGFRSSISIYLNRRVHREGAGDICIAPRGEFSAGALSIKSKKKRLFLAAARIAGLYKDIQWHASSSLEAEDILRQFPEANGQIHIAADPVSLGEYRGEFEASVKAVGQLRIAFISRISPMKNLAGLLKILSEVDRRIELSIFGPIEDREYWERCRKILESLPGNVEVRYEGALTPDEVSENFRRFDLFAFPTFGENFGHVIFEALRAGTPVLVSDNTPWKATTSGAISVVPLDAVDLWRHHIVAAADRDHDRQCALRSAAIDDAKSYMASTSAGSDSLRMFRAIVARKK